MKRNGGGHRIAGLGSQKPDWASISPCAKSYGRIGSLVKSGHVFGVSRKRRPRPAQYGLCT
jgi:hypothetical protein